MANDAYNPIFQKILDRAETDGDRITGYIAYGIYKELKRAYLITRSEELGEPVPQEEIDTFVRTYDDGQIELIWNAANGSLATFAVNYAEDEKEQAVRAALEDALKGNFWKNVGVTTAANTVFAIGVVVVYFLFLFFGVDLLDQLRALERLYPNG